MNLPSKQVDIVSLRGGINRASTFVEIPPGAALDLLNFEPELEGGYRRIAGYQRLDGRTDPTTARYYTLGVDDPLIVPIDSDLVGQNSGATARVVANDGFILGITAINGEFELGESVGPVRVTALPVPDGLSDIAKGAEWQLAAENYYRSLIQPVPGDGPILGAVQYGNRAYAFRADGAEVKLYRTTPSGWQHIPFGHVLFFSGGIAAIPEGSEITGDASSATATVKRYVRNAGSFGDDASGYMVLDITSGTFEDGENLKVDGVIQAKAEGEPQAITLAPGGRFQFDQHNFYGGSDTIRLYGCDGVNPAWEFDGETLVPIYFPEPETNPDWNKPTFLAAHRSHLFLAFPGGRLAHSGIGEPLSFSALMGAAEIGLGDEATGMTVMAGNVLAIYTRSMTYGLYGTSAEDWDLQVISESFGAKPYTVQKVGTVYALDDKGIAPLQRVQAYGDFESATVSRFAQPILEEYKDRVLGSVVVKARNQYRLFFTDGTALVMSDDAYLANTLPSFATLAFAHAPVCLSNAPDEHGNEVILFGDEQGFVYQMEKGYNFDGEPIEFAYRSPFMNQKAPHTRKSYRRLYLDLATTQTVRLSVSAELSYSDYAIPANAAGEIAVLGGGGYYDNANWDEIYWDAATYASRGIPLSGTGRNISILIYGNSATTRPFTIQTLEIHYLSRRLKRGQ